MNSKYTHLLLAFAACAAADAATIQISTASGIDGADTFIRNDSVVNGATFNYGGANQILAGTNNGAGPLTTLLRFDLAGLQAAAAGQEILINSVTLTLRTTATVGVNPNNTQFTLSLFEYQRFVEGTGNGSAVAGSTYNNPAGNGNDATAGGTVGTALTSGAQNSVATGQTITLPSSIGIVAQFQAAYNSNTNPNYLLKENPLVVDQTFLRFESKETSGGFAPTLTIDYSVVPEPSAALLGSVAALGLLRRKRR